MSAHGQFQLSIDRWVGGRLLKRVVTQLIPEFLRGFPITALLWSGVILELLICARLHPHTNIRPGGAQSMSAATHQQVSSSLSGYRPICASPRRWALMTSGVRGR
ncbi:MAG: hypothetical protein JWR32_1379 [Mycobacterium sp.]|nr:hypothetical protein [Mycobacterium sp.]